MIQIGSIFQKPRCMPSLFVSWIRITSWSYLLVNIKFTSMDKPVFVPCASSNPAYAVIEISSTVNLFKNIMNLFSHGKISIYEWKDNTLKNYNIFPQYELLSFKRYINKYVKQISFLYNKTVTFNISVSQSSSSLTHGTAAPLDLPPAIQSKISSTSYDNATWHTDFFKQDPSATSCKISQTWYVCLKAQF